MERLVGLLGIAVLLGLAVLFSEARKKLPWRVIAVGVPMQFLLAAILLKLPGAAQVFEVLATSFTKLLRFGPEAGGAFIFGELTNAGGPWGFLFLTQVLPVIIFFASLMGVLYHLGVMQRLISGLAWLFQRALGVTGTEALCAAANVFVGQTEAPLVVKPYISGMTRSQLMIIMTTGFATIAGSVLGGIVTMLAGGDEQTAIEIAKHLLTASLISAPGAFVIAKIMIPETQTPPDETDLFLSKEKSTRNVLDAAASGATDGMKLALNVAGMLIAFVGMVALINWPLGAIGSAIGVPELSLQWIFGWIFRPASLLMGVAPEDAGEIASVLGTSVAVTEFVAYEQLGNLIAAEEVSTRSRTIATFALCGFANLPSIAIQIGGLSAMAPERRAEIAGMGFRAMCAGLLACWMTACVAGVLL